LIGEKNTIESMPGVTRADVNLESLRVDIYGDGFSKTNISAALQEVGYKPGD